MTNGPGGAAFIAGRPIAIAHAAHEAARRALRDHPAFRIAGQRFVLSPQMNRLIGSLDPITAKTLTDVGLQVAWQIDPALSNEDQLAHIREVWPGFASVVQPIIDALREEVTVRHYFSRWSSLSQAQYLELTTLLSSYILSSQGDRQLLANGVEGRFPFLDRDIIDFCNSLPDSYKLRGLDEKHVLKRMAADIVPREILERKKQPYRAPDAVCFFGSKAPDYVRELMSERAVADSGVFEPRAVTALVSKMERLAADPINPPTTADNMAMVAILSPCNSYTTTFSPRPLHPPPGSSRSMSTSVSSPIHPPEH